MSESAVKHTALDGSLVEIASSHDLGVPATTYLFAAQHEFESGTIPFVREIASEFQISQFDEAYELQGGTLYRAARLLEDQQGDEFLYSLAVWEGTTFSVKTRVGAQFPSSEVIELFNLFTIQESPTGISLIPRESRGSIDYEARVAPSIVKGLPRLGTLTIRQLTRETARHLPPWGGYAVAGGQLYKDRPTSQDERQMFTHVADKAMSSLWPEPDADLSDVVSALSELRVQWSKGG